MTERRIAELVYLASLRIVRSKVDILSELSDNLSPKNVDRMIDYTHNFNLIDSLNEFKDACEMIKKTDEEFPKKDLKE